MSELIGKIWNVLDKGFITLVDVMGNDQSIVDAARVSYGKGTKKVSDDRNLIRYLMRNGHLTPFEMCSAKFIIKMPIYCARQLVRYRTAKMNEVSQRYSEVEDDFEQTDKSQWRTQSTNNKQGSGDNIWEEDGIYLSLDEVEINNKCMEIYEKRLKMGVSREQARKCLPLSVYTKFYWKMDLRNLFNFLEQRMDSHAQHEIRQYANVIGREIVSKLWPIAWEAFEDYRLNAINFSGLEIKAMQAINCNDWDKYNQVKNSLSKRELEEFRGKLKLIDLNEI